MVLFFSDHDVKPIILLSPDVRVQTELKKHKNVLHSDSRKKSLIDSGIELFFKKNSKQVKDGGVIASSSNQTVSHPLSSEFKSSAETTSVPAHFVDKDVSSHHSHSATDEHHKWKLFDTIKIHTDKKRSADPSGNLPKYYETFSKLLNTMRHSVNY